MAVAPNPLNPSSPSTPAYGTLEGASSVRQALGRLRTLISLGLAISVLAFVEGYLSWGGFYTALERIGRNALSLTWWDGVQIALVVALAVAIVVLAIVAFVTAIRGLLVWRRGVLKMVQSAPELGAAHVASCRQAREEHSLTLWLFLVYVFVAVAVSAGIAGTAATAGTSIPSWLTSLASGLATGGVLVAIYYYGASHLSSLLGAVATPSEASLLRRGTTRMVAGALVGVLAALSAYSWWFGVIGIVSLAIILVGVGDLVVAYDSWLSARRGPPAPFPGGRAAPA